MARTITSGLTHMKLTGAIPLFGLSLLIAITFSCQSVSRNNREPPQLTQVDPGQDVMADMIAKEILPALASARTSLTMLNALETDLGPGDQLSVLFFDLERAFKSTSIPQSVDEAPNSATKDSHYKFELPFVNGKSKETIVAKISKVRDPSQPIYDIFGTVAQDPSKGDGLDVMLSRFNETGNGETYAFWIFDVPRLNGFFKKLYGTDKNILDSTINIEFTMSGDEQDLVVWSQEPKKAIGGMTWKAFHAKANLKSPDETKITFMLKCGDLNQNFALTLDKKTIADKFQKAVLDSLKSNMDPLCSKI